MKNKCNAQKGNIEDGEQVFRQIPAFVIIQVMEHQVKKQEKDAQFI